MRRFAKPLYGLTPVPRVRIPPSPPCFQLLTCHQITSQISYAGISTNRTIFSCACRICCSANVPYLIVVRMSVCLISFLCTLRGVPTSSSHDRNVWRKQCELIWPMPAFEAAFRSACLLAMRGDLPRPHLPMFVLERSQIEQCQS